MIASLGASPVTRVLLIFAASMLSVTRSAYGQIPASTTDPSKVTEVVRVAAPPRLDGVLDDEAWQAAASITDMHQVFPLNHAPATEDTEILLGYDDKFLYVGARLFYSEREQITARVMAQGESIQFDDAIAIILDTFNNKRTGYQFAVNPNGVRDDGVFETPAKLNRDWEGNVDGGNVRRAVGRVEEALPMPRDARHVYRRELVLRERDLVVFVEIPEPFRDTPRRVGACEARHEEKRRLAIAFFKNGFCVP